MQHHGKVSPFEVLASLGKLAGAILREGMGLIGVADGCHQGISPSDQPTCKDLNMTPRNWYPICNALLLQNSE